MTPELFFENFAHLSDAPNGVKKLRELILQLAVRGKLVPQNSNDAPAAKLLEQIQADKARITKEKNIKKSDSLRLVSEDEIPHELPNGWQWVRLGACVEYDAAIKVDPKDISDDDWLLDLEDIEKDTSNILQRRTFKEKQSQSNKARFLVNDILYGKLRPYLNKVVVADSNGYCTTEIISLRCYCNISPHYIRLYLKNPDFLSYVNSKTYGVKMPRLGTEDGKNALVSLPPPDEQHRIVAKVDQLMLLCDELENRQQKKQTKLTRLNNATLDQLTSARKADDFTTACQFVRDNFDLLYTTPETIAKLRQSILQLAVQGKLVPQDPNNEPASVLLERIKVEKERLVKEKKIRKSEPLPPVSADEVPYELPEGWEIQRFVELADIVGGVTKGRNLVGRNTASFPYLRVANVQRGYLGLDVMKEIEIPVDELEKYKLNIGDLLITEGGDWDKVGRTAIWNCQIDVCIHQNHVFRARLFDVLMNRFWVMQFFNSSLGRRYFEKASKQTTNLASINMTQLRNCPVPIPPLEEQHRIVAKVDQLMTLCDNLEARLTKAQGKADKLTASTVQCLLAA